MNQRTKQDTAKPTKGILVKGGRVKARTNNVSFSGVKVEECSGKEHLDSTKASIQHTIERKQKDDVQQRKKAKSWINVGKKPILKEVLSKQVQLQMVKQVLYSKNTTTQEKLYLIEEILNLSI